MICCMWEGLVELCHGGLTLPIIRCGVFLLYFVFFNVAYSFAELELFGLRLFILIVCL